MPKNPGDFAEVFTRAGVNPQSMNPKISGDTVLTHSMPGTRIAAIVDGAWVAGFDHIKKLDIANWSSQLIARYFAHAAEQLPRNRQSFCARGIVLSSLKPYSDACEKLRRNTGYVFDPPAPFADIDIRKIGPQSAFVLAVFHRNGYLEIAQVRDCLAILEMKDGTFRRLTPNQSQKVKEATADMDIQHEAIRSYQPDMKKVHKPAFFEMAREALDKLCLFHNSANFLNHPHAKVGWGMFTGEMDMLPWMNEILLTPDELTDAKRLWLMSDGAFKMGDVENDVKLLSQLGPERYYDEVLLPRFTCFAPGVAPVDVSIMKIDLPVRQMMIPMSKDEDILKIVD